MSATTEAPDSGALVRAAACAVRAPSVHNIQPWRFVRSGNRLTMQVDRSRQLKVLDPSGRQMLISCGCALFNARVSAASDGYHARVERFPEGQASDTFARITLRPADTGSPDEIARAYRAELRKWVTTDADRLGQPADPDRRGSGHPGRAAARTRARHVPARAAPDRPGRNDPAGPPAPAPRRSGRRAPLGPTSPARSGALG